MPRRGRLLGAFVAALIGTGVLATSADAAVNVLPIPHDSAVSKGQAFVAAQPVVYSRVLPNPSIQQGCSVLANRAAVPTVDCSRITTEGCSVLAKAQLQPPVTLQCASRARRKGCSVLIERLKPNEPCPKAGRHGRISHAD